MADSVVDTLNEIHLQAERSSLISAFATQMSLVSGDALSKGSLLMVSSIVSRMNTAGVQHYSGKLANTTEAFDGELKKAPEIMFEGDFGHEDDVKFLNESIATIATIGKNYELNSDSPVDENIKSNAQAEADDAMIFEAETEKFRKGLILDVKRHASFDADDEGINLVSSIKFIEKLKYSGLKKVSSAMSSAASKGILASDENELKDSDFRKGINPYVADDEGKSDWMYDKFLTSFMSTDARELLNASSEEAVTVDDGLQTELAQDYQTHATLLEASEVKTDFAKDYKAHATSLERKETDELAAEAGNQSPSAALMEIDAQINAIQLQREALMEELAKLDSNENALLEKREKVIDALSIEPALEGSSMDKENDEYNESDIPPAEFDEPVLVQSASPEYSNRGVATAAILSFAVMGAAMYGTEDTVVQAADFVANGGTHLINQGSGMLTQAIAASTEVASAAYGTTMAYGSDLITQTNGMLDNVGTIYEEAWSAASTTALSGIDNVNKGGMDLYAQMSSFVSSAVESGTKAISETVNSVQNHISENKHDLQVAGVSSLLTATVIGGYVAMLNISRSNSNHEATMKAAHGM